MKERAEGDRARSSRWVHQERSAALHGVANMRRLAQRPDANLKEKGEPRVAYSPL
jgi:hypothetical protein